MRPAFEQIDEAAGKVRLGVGHEVAHGVGERKAIDLPDAERCRLAIANPEDNLITAAFARRVTAPVILLTDVSREIVRAVVTPQPAPTGLASRAPSSIRR